MAFLMNIYKVVFVCSLEAAILSKRRSFFILVKLLHIILHIQIVLNETTVQEYEDGGEFNGGPK